ESAATLVADPAVVAAWAAPSALEGFTVGGLAAHLAVQVLFVPKTLADPPPPDEVVTLEGHYTRAAWVGADLDDEVNVQIRRGGGTARPHPRRTRPGQHRRLLTMRSRAAPAYRAGLVGEVARAVRPVVEPVDLLEVLDGLQLGLAVRARARLALVTGYRLEGV